MSETIDKATDKLMASIQKSQKPTNDTKSTSKNTTNTKAAPKASISQEPGVKKVIDQIVNPIESPRKFRGNLRWPD